MVRGRVVGDAGLLIQDAATLRDAKAGEITFIDAPKRRGLLAKSAASAAVVPLDIDVQGLSVIQVADVQRAFTAIYHHFHPPRATRRVGISPAAIVSPSARLAFDVDVHAGAVIGDEVEIGAGSTIHSGVCLGAGCRIGRNVTIYPNAVLYENTVVGDQVIIHGCAVLGADGFGYRFVNGRHELTPQLGYVIIESCVEIGAGTTIDRGSYGPTRVGEGTKIDDQVMIGHNGRIGRHNILCSQVGVAGSATTGDYVVMGGQAGVRDHIHIGARAQLAAQCGVMKDVPPNEKVVLSPAQTYRQAAENKIMIERLPEMRRQLKELQKTVAELQKQLNSSTRHAA
jgi:UDP-3-O-[3-hydroxymyristoyl] glucosamine N-acyltransferase